jgi:type IV pilus assembly protein PilW
MRSRPRAVPGFSLVELLVALLVSVVVILGAATLLRAQQASFRLTSSERAVQETGRIALQHIAENLRTAGFGVDPGLAFDFGAQSNARMDRAPAGGSFATSSLACGSAVACRDRVDGPDELVFLARDPSFGHALASAATASSSGLVIQGPLRAPLHKGQLLQVLCYAGDMRWAYVQVSQEVAASSATTITIPIESNSSASYPWPTQNSLLGNACYSTVANAVDPSSLLAAAKVFKVDRFRYFIRNYAADGSVVAWGTAGSRPWLMLDQGLTDASNVPLVDVIAPDVEDLQVAYVFPADATNTVVGATPGTALTSGATSIDLTSAPPVYSDDLAAISRTTHHPANIRAVRVAIVARGADKDLSLRDVTYLPALLNRPVTAGEEGFRRQPFETSLAVRNLDARAPYFPIWDAGSITLNVGGG